MQETKRAIDELDDYTKTLSIGKSKKNMMVQMSEFWQKNIIYLRQLFTL